MFIFKKEVKINSELTPRLRPIGRKNDETIDSVLQQAFNWPIS